MKRKQNEGEKLQNGELHKIFSLFRIIKVIKSKGGKRGRICVMHRENKKCLETLDKTPHGKKTT
jgi:hypothetical protein